MYKKSRIVLLTLVFLVGCSSNEGTNDDANITSSENGGSTERNAQKEAADITFSEFAPTENEGETVEVISSFLTDEVWVDVHEEQYIQFTDIDDTKLEFLMFYTAPGRNETEELLVRGDLYELTENTARGFITLSNSREGEASILGNPEFEIHLVDTGFSLVMENDFSLNMLPSTYSISDWENLQPTGFETEIKDETATEADINNDIVTKADSAKSLDPNEAFNIMLRGEDAARKIFGDAFIDAPEGYSFNLSYDELILDLKQYFTRAYQAQNLKKIYENPVLIMEPLYSFPFTEIPLDSYIVDESNEKIELIFEEDFYGDPYLYTYVLIVEDGLWKVNSFESEPI